MRGFLQDADAEALARLTTSATSPRPQRDATWPVTRPLSKY